MEDLDRRELRRIGDIAAASGLTVRTLRYYEERGLITPTDRSSAGHRLYGAEAFDRLYRVCLLRRLGLSLDEIPNVLDDPAWSLRSTLQHHQVMVERTLTNTAQIAARLAAAVASLDGTDGRATDDLLAIVEDMTMLDSLVQQRISILVYTDLRRAYDYLIDVFGLGPGTLATDPDGNVVHGELHAGDGVVWLHPETSRFGLASPLTLGAATATMAVMVDDVDAHYRRATAKGADVVYEPVDQPYGYREYSARDCEGALWSFMRALD